ncbi:hypothetical protein SPFM12_00292 [Salmonella phage SPFM12]|nr:hypothetical protein SPFM12_00292 [Salmonella phage SPFM12]
MWGMAGLTPEDGAKKTKVYSMSSGIKDDVRFYEILSVIVILEQLRGMWGTEKVLPLNCFVNGLGKGKNFLTFIPPDPAFEPAVAYLFLASYAELTVRSSEVFKYESLLARAEIADTSESR